MQYRPPAQTSDSASSPSHHGRKLTLKYLGSRSRRETPVAFCTILRREAWLSGLTQKGEARPAPESCAVPRGRTRNIACRGFVECARRSFASTATAPRSQAEPLILALPNHRSPNGLCLRVSTLRRSLPRAAHGFRHRSNDSYSQYSRSGNPPRSGGGVGR